MRFAHLAASAAITVLLLGGTSAPTAAQTQGAGAHHGGSPQAAGQQPQGQAGPGMMGMGGHGQMGPGQMGAGLMGMGGHGPMGDGQMGMMSDEHRAMMREHRSRMQGMRRHMRQGPSANDGGDHYTMDDGPTDPVVGAFDAINRRMHKDMTPAEGVSPDVAFAKGMLPHHQAAVDMAKVVLAFGGDPEIKQLAEAIIKAQLEEIAFMRAWLAKQPQ